MTVKMNGAGRAHMDSLVEAGKVDKNSAWDLSTDERDGLDGSMFLGDDTSMPETDKGHWKYPFGKGGKVYASALRAIDSRAGAQGETEIQSAAKEALQKIEGSKSGGKTSHSMTLRNREIFSVGTWKGSKKVTADTKFLDSIVSSYEGLNSKVNGYSIPIKLGHNRKIGEPAYGYATNVHRDGGTLLADFEDMPPEIVDAINAKRYNAVSVELWPEIEHAGEVFEQVLGGVALLGAEWPAVKGLKPVYASEFSADGGTTLVEKVEDMPNTFTQEQIDLAVANALAPVNTAVAALTAERDTAVAALSIFQDEVEKGTIAAIILAAEKAGKIVPANRPKVEAFAEKLRATLKGADRTSVIAMFKEFVDGLPVKIDFNERARGGSQEDRPGTGGATAGEEVNFKVQALRKERGPDKLSYKAALNEVFEAHPDLKDRYAAENRTRSNVDDEE